MVAKRAAATAKVASKQNRINPLRWTKGAPPPLDGVLETVRDRAAKFNAEKVQHQDLARADGPAEEQ